MLDQGISRSHVQVGNLVRYRPELIDKRFLELHGSVVLDCVFTVLETKHEDGQLFVKAQVPGTPFTRDIEADLLQSV